jgi:isoleucyl-tRNA synthetase
MLGNLHDFDPRVHTVPYEKMEEIDRWALMQLTTLSRRMRTAYEACDLHIAYHAAHRFASVDLGGFYLDVLKDRLYCDPANSQKRRSAQTAFLTIMKELTQLLAPILVFTAEEIWEHLPDKVRPEKSVHFTTWQELPAEYWNSDLNEHWEGLLEIRRVVSKGLEMARAEKLIGAANEAAVVIYANERHSSVLESFAEDLRLLFIVSAVDVMPLESEEKQHALYSEEGIAVDVTRAGGEKCERCWKYFSELSTHPEHTKICQRCSDAL